VDLPAYGRRARGLVPREETGAPRDADLTRRFSIGESLEVEVLEMHEGKIRLRLHAPKSALPGLEEPAPPPAERERVRGREADRDRSKERGPRDRGRERGARERGGRERAASERGGAERGAPEPGGTERGAPRRRDDR